MVQSSISATRADSPPTGKRPRLADMDSYHTNGNHSSSSVHPHAKSQVGVTTTVGGSGNLPPLSLSILGVEPLDEFIKEIADFIHHMIMVVSPNYPPGRIEVEAKVGVLRDRTSGRRFELPVLVETSMFCGFFFYAPILLIFLAVVIYEVLQPDSVDIRFESNMSAVRFLTLMDHLVGNMVNSNNTNTSITASTS